MSKYRLSVYRIDDPGDFFGEQVSVEKSVEGITLKLPGFSIRYHGFSHTASLMGVLAPGDEPWSPAVVTLVYFLRRIESPFPSYLRLGVTASFGTDKFFVTVDGFPVYWGEGADSVVSHRKVRDFVRKRMVLGGI